MATTIESDFTQSSLFLSEFAFIKELFTYMSMNCTVRIEEVTLHSFDDFATC